jgi:hypothetical protein
MIAICKEKDKYASEYIQNCEYTMPKTFNSEFTNCGSN